MKGSMFYNFFAETTEKYANFEHDLNYLINMFPSLLFFERSEIYELTNARHANVSAFVTIFRIIFSVARIYADVKNSWQRARVCST